MDTGRIEEIRVSIDGYKKSFLKYNSAKLTSLNSSLADPELVHLFNYIPFLLTVNQPEFPGYVKECPHPPGIENYTVSSNVISRVRIKNPSYSAESRPENPPVIKMLALIGSAGTIAFTPESDFDYWICGDFSSMPADEVSHLRRKCRLIEEWVIDHHGREIHFFLNDIDHIKMNIFDEDDEYGLSGTSLGQMLKEEFYRSSIIINSVVPFWWAVPADCGDDQYNEWRSALEGTPAEKEFIDLGNLSVLNRSEFLIAALFQIIKSLGNPFKSIIKLGLLEKYINDQKGNPFISNMIKKNVHENRMDSFSVDAYCIMFDQVYDYHLKSNNDVTSVNILKTCFYLKVNPVLSQSGKNAGDPAAREIMKQYAKKWGWDAGIIKHVDNFENWDVEATVKMMNNTKRRILKGYKSILNALGSEVNSGSIDNMTLQSINRKIFSHFQMEDFKIDNTLNFKKYPPEKLLTLDFTRDLKGNESWYLHKRVITTGKPVKVFIKKSKYLISLIIWIALNGLYQKNFSRLDIEQGFYHMDPNFVRDLISELSSRFTIKSMHLFNSFFLRDPFPVMSYIIINPFLKYSNKIDDIYFVYHNSWGETRFEVHHLEKELPSILARVASGMLLSGMDATNALRIISSEPYSSTKNFQSLKKSITDMLSFFRMSKPGVKQRWLTMSGNRYLIYSNTVKRSGSGSVALFECASAVQMLYTISYNKGARCEIAVDESSRELAHITKILSYYRSDTINIFFEESKNFTGFYVLNETGALMYYRKRSAIKSEYLASLIQFSLSAAASVISADPQSSLAESSDAVKVYKLTRNQNDMAIIEDYPYEKDAVLTNYIESSMPVSLSLHLLDSGEIGYRFTLPDGGYSEIFSRSGIESVSREIAALIESIQGYSYFPNAVNLENSAINLYRSRTSFALSEKNRFEILIEKNLGIT
jgi:adenylate cyclase class 1